MSVITSSDASPLTAAIRAACSRSGAALIPYITAGHPSPELTLPVMRMLAAEGADVIELGIPFSDPLADGPVIQRSSFEAIAQGADLAWTLRTLAEFRRTSPVPVVLFTYLNPVIRYGLDAFLADAASAGAQGVLVTDLPLGADPLMERRFDESSLDLIRLAAPTTAPERIARIAGAARGFLYYVSRTGVTGAAQSLAEGLADEVAHLRGLTELPVAVGFGISSAEQAAAVARVADGVVVGSALVDALARGGLERATALVRELRSATRLPD